VAIGLHRAAGHRTIVLVHHAIEMFGPDETGYAVTGSVRFGAHWALRRVCRSDLIVFSPVVERLLRKNYGARSIDLVPLPGERPGPEQPIVGAGRIVTVGYLAPYKGIDLFLGRAQRRPVHREYVLAGTQQPILVARPEFPGSFSRCLGQRLAPHEQEQRYCQDSQYRNAKRELRNWRRSGCGGR
jgi:hypothetical protein